MRFFEDGLSIPDELLTAHEEGRVVFFCGAGISIARAKLPTFFGLVDKVIEILHVPPDSPACKILAEAKKIGERTGVNGLISADSIFGLLERDFLVRDIEAAVAQSLKPSPDADLSVHQILLDLASTPEGKIRLVTTNFDRLFDSCDSNLKVWQPPQLPNPSNYHEMDGIIHLHGCTNKNYTKSDGSGFILSSSEFGRAYLSEAWATAFFKEIIEKYIVVFIGYSADDPPVRYLLEALNKRKDQLNGVYAFQSGESSEARSLWIHKGVQALSYTKENRNVLWETLKAWGVKAKTSDTWYQSVISCAKTNPAKLKPHERGQVAHIVSTLEGAKRFAEADPPLPAEWLYVFDPYQRYAKPTQNYVDLQESSVDPFNLYGLDSDIEPITIDKVTRYTKREIPKGAWDALARNRLDCQNFQEEDFSAFRGRFATNVSKLSKRMHYIGWWLTKVADQPATVWWAASQNGLHPDIQRNIQQALADPKRTIHPNIRQAWRYLFEFWNTNINDISLRFDELKKLTDESDWNSSIAREYISISRAYLIFKPSYRRPIENSSEIQVEDMLQLKAEYPDSKNLMIPDELLAVIVGGLRKNLEYAIQLEVEIGSYSLKSIPPIIPDNRPDINDYVRSRGLPSMVMLFSNLFKRLMHLNIAKARKEFKFWPSDDDTIFCRLRIWASGESELISGKDFGLIIVGLSEDAFWDYFHRRDLLLVLARRWKELHLDSKKEIENRLLNGSANVEYEKEWVAFESLNKITWLANNHCDFTFNLNFETQKLLLISPNWKPENAIRAADSTESLGGIIQTKYEYSLLLNEPYSSILSKALELSGRKENFLIEDDPFAGLSAERPARAFSALTHAAKQNEYPEWAWRKFLCSEARKNDKPKFSYLIAERLSSYPNEAFPNFVSTVSYWILNTDKKLSYTFPESFEKVISKLINLLQINSSLGNTTIATTSRGTDWIMAALNTSVGRIAQSLFNDKRINDIQENNIFNIEWLIHIEGLLSLNDDLKRHAIVFLARNLDWFYFRDSNWCKAHLLSILKREDEKDQDAFWSGFLWGAKVPCVELYEIIKDDLITISKADKSTKHGVHEALAGIILAGWINVKGEAQKRFISNEEMRDVLLFSSEHFKLQLLWQIEIWFTNSEEKFIDLLPVFFNDVWPRQVSAKTSALSSRILDIVFLSPNGFPQLVKIILPLLTTINYCYTNIEFPDWTKSYPHQTLDLLNVVLSSDIKSWPYKVEEIFQRISDADERLNSDERLLELKRKWNAR
jgi:SIR2-like domain